MLDDLHWGDAASVQLRGHGAARLPGAARPRAGTGPARGARAASPPVGERGVQRSTCGRCHAAPASGWCARCSARASRANPERLVAQADGNAFYLEELIRAVAAGRAPCPRRRWPWCSRASRRWSPMRAGCCEPPASSARSSGWGPPSPCSGGDEGGGRRRTGSRTWCSRRCSVRRPESRFPGRRSSASATGCSARAPMPCSLEEDQRPGAPPRWRVARAARRERCADARGALRAGR